MTKPQRFTARFFALLLLLLHQTALTIADVLRKRDWRDRRDVQVLIPRVSPFPPTSPVSHGHRHPYSSGMVMVIPPITSLSLKSRFGLSR